MIELRDVYKTYRMGTNLVHALRGVSLTIEPGEFVAIAGPSGSGKSTLMHIIGLLDVPDSGSYRLGGREVARMNEDELAVLRRGEIGFVFQQFHLLARTTAVENVSLPLLYSRGGYDLTAARELLGQVGLAERATHRPNELSGGQQQRVAIARSLINRPTILLADEPTGNLDTASQEEILAILHDLNRQGMTVIIVTHEEEVARAATRRIQMRDGVIQSDKTDRISAPTPALPSVTCGDALRSRKTGVGSDHEGRGEGAAGELRHLEAPVDRSHPSSTSLISKGETRFTGEPTRAARTHFAGLEHVRHGMRALAANKVRTALSVLGILIGVAAVVAMLAIGRGAQQAIERQLSSLGSNLLVLRPGAVRIGGVVQEAGVTTRLTIDDVAAIKERVPGVRNAAPTVNGRARATFANKNWNTFVLGVSTDYAQMRASQPTIGRFFTEEENRSRARVALIGLTLVQELFGGENPIGESIKLNRVSFTVIGVLPEKGTSAWRDQDDTVVIPVQTAMYRLLGKNYLDYIDIEAESPEAIQGVQEETKEMMLTRRRIPAALREDAYQIRDLSDIRAVFEESSRTLSTLLAVIAAISLLVGGIGIMNIMLVSVTERTREIGLRKAVGARPRDILNQFLVEAVVVSVAGGIAGIVLAWIVTVVLAYAVGWTTAITPASVLLAFAFSALVGIVFGIYPARRAAALNPIQALRYE